MYLTKTRRFTKLMGAILMLFFLLAYIGQVDINKPNSYRNNSWGILYVTTKTSPIYYRPEKEDSIYDLPKNTLIMCDTKYEDELLYSVNGKVFCWYLFDMEKHPIAGWIKIDDTKEYRE